MIQHLLFSLVAGLPTFLPQDDVELRVREFVQRAQSGVSGQLAPLPPNFEISVNRPHPHDPTWREIEFRAPGSRVGGKIVMDPQGKIGYYQDNFTFDGSWDPLAALRPDVVAPLAEAYYEAAGFTGGLSMKTVTPNHSGSAYLLQSVPKHGGVPFHPQFDVTILIDHQTGKLDTLMRTIPCHPPQNLVPAIDLQTARARMMSHLFSIRPHLTQVSEHHQVQLMIWRPLTRGGPYDYLTAQQREMAQNNQGMLVYWTWVHDTGEPPSPKLGTGPPYEIVLDAATGRVLYVGAYEGGWGGSGEAPSGELPSLAWDLGDGSLRIFAEGRSVEVRDASVEPVEAAPPTGKEIPVLLHREGRTVRALFDPAAGTLRMERGAERIGGRPDAALLEALRRLAPETSGG
jgi:hypothetical protein